MGCAEFANQGISQGASIQSIGIGMSKDEVAEVVGRGNANLCRKKTKRTANGQVDEWLLFRFQMFGPANWSWDAPGTPVRVEFTDGKVSSVEG